MSEAIGGYAQGRYKWARGTVTDSIKQKLLRMIGASGDMPAMLAEDIIEVMIEARNSADGLRAADRLLDAYSGDYELHESKQERT